MDKKTQFLKKRVPLTYRQIKVADPQMEFRQYTWPVVQVLNVHRENQNMLTLFCSSLLLLKLKMDY